MSKFKSMLVLMISLALFATACDKKKEEASADGADKAAAEKAEDKAAEQKADEKTAEKAAEKAEGEKLAMVEVSKKGTKFDPSVKVEQIPSGTWMCDMGGNVEYAAMEKGDGKCPVCHMNLKQQKAEGGEKAAAKGEMKEGHKGH